MVASCSSGTQAFSAIVVNDLYVKIQTTMWCNMAAGAPAIIAVFQTAKGGRKKGSTFQLSQLSLTRLPGSPSQPLCLQSHWPALSHLTTTYYKEVVKFNLLVEYITAQNKINCSITKEEGAKNIGWLQSDSAIVTYCDTWQMLRLDKYIFMPLFFLFC